MPDSRDDTLAAGSTLLVAPTAPDDPDRPGEPLLLEGDALARRYEPLEELGRGGMGAVTLCLDRQLGRRVAMKTIAPGLDRRRSAHHRFVREVRIQGQLEHPAVVPVYDLGRTPDGALFFTMKRVRGETLEAIVKARAEAPDARPLPSRHRLLTAFGQVCLAVDFAHQRGVLHRDLKPANVMLGDFGEVYVLDWGLAELDHGHGAPSPLERPAGGEARPGAIVGTPGYMAPEQAEGRVDALSPATDVYALGAILFELLTARPLHEGTSVAELVASTLGGVEARPSVRAPEAEVPPELEAIVLRATAARPEDRYSSARELHRDLEAYLDGERDEARRRALSAEHGERARSLADRALATPTAAAPRREAMREIGRSLALDPGNRDALSTLLRLLTSPPETLPPEVEESYARAQDQRMRWVARIAVVAYASMLLYLPFLWASGIVRPLPVAVFYGGVGIAALASWRVSRGVDVDWRAVLVAMLGSNVGLAATATFFGPLFVTPALVATNTTAYALYVDRRYRSFAIGSAALLVGATLALFFTGCWPGTYALRDGAMTIHSGALGLEPTATLVFLSVVALGTVLTSTVALGRARADLERAEKRLHLQRWQIAAMVPAADVEMEVNAVDPMGSAPGRRDA